MQIALSFFVDILLPFGAHRLYRRGLINGLEAGVLAIFSVVYIYAIVRFRAAPFTLDVALLHFSVCAIAAGSIDALVDRGSANKLFAWRIMIIVFGIGFSVLIGLKSMALAGMFGAYPSSPERIFNNVAVWLGSLLCLLSTSYFAIRFYNVAQQYRKRRIDSRTKD